MDCGKQANRRKLVELKQHREGTICAPVELALGRAVVTQGVGVLDDMQGMPVFCRKIAHRRELASASHMALLKVGDADHGLAVEAVHLLLGFLHFEAESRLFVLKRGERTLAHLEVFLKRLQRCFIKLICNSHFFES